MVPWHNALKKEGVYRPNLLRSPDELSTFGFTQSFSTQHDVPPPSRTLFLLFSRQEVGAVHTTDFDRASAVLENHARRVLPAQRCQLYVGVAARPGDELSDRPGDSVVLMQPTIRSAHGVRECEEGKSAGLKGLTDWWRAFQGVRVVCVCGERMMRCQ